MATEKLRLRVATPENIKFDGDADMVVLRCITGDMGILPNHEAYSAILDYGVLRILLEGYERRMAVFGGLAQIHDNVVTVLANDAQWPEDIDIALVEAEREQATRNLQESVDALSIQRDQVAVRRTLVQIEVSTYPLINRAEREDDNKG